MRPSDSGAGCASLGRSNPGALASNAVAAPVSSSHIQTAPPEISLLSLGNSEASDGRPTTPAVAGPRGSGKKEAPALRSILNGTLPVAWPRCLTLALPTRARQSRCYASPVQPRALLTPLARLSCCLFGAGALLACAPKDPPRWAQGGASLAFAPAHWDRDGDDVEIRANGQVFIDGDLEFVIDRVGRVANDDYEPYAVLLPDGQLAGTDNTSLGRVGISNASPPGGVEAWLAVMPDGRVTYFDLDGDRSFGGGWRGCSGPVQRTCTLVTQLVALRSYRPSSGVGIGIGVGVGVGF
jgi:hypothetical protein